jgi:uncharacterized repeat protein (TIGR03803 family)
MGSLTLSGSTLYGTTSGGGANAYGTVFSIDTNGTGYMDLYDFNTPFGTQPRATLSLSGSTLFGTTVVGGLYGDGVIFSLAITHPTVSCILTQDTAPSTWDAYPSYSSNVTSARWYWGDGSSTTNLYPSHTYSVAGRYNICVTAYSSYGDSAVYCQNDSLYRLSNNNTQNNMVYVNVLHSQATGINQVTDINNQISIYPNPSNGTFVIEPNSTTNQTIQLYDVNGKVVLSQTINGKTTLDAGSLNGGVYNISIMGNEGVVNKRLIIMR